MSFKLMAASIIDIAIQQDKTPTPAATETKFIEWLRK
jgi:hypothetical protein